MSHARRTENQNMNEDQSDETSENDTMGGPAHDAPTATSAHAPVEIAGTPSALCSGDLFGVLENALRDAERSKNGARLADYAADITEAVRRARRMAWHMKNAAEIAKDRGDLFTAGEAMRAAYVVHIGTEKSARVNQWDEAAQPMRNLIAWLSSPNNASQPRAD